MQTAALADLIDIVRSADAAAAPPGDLAAHIARTLAREPAKPFITWYDDRTGERVELSYATFANWVWKTANYLRDGLDVQPADEVGVLLRTHWQTVAIWYGVWVAGAVVVPLEEATLTGRPVVAVFAQQDALASVTAARVARGAVVGLSLQPMGARLTQVPAGVVDFATEVPGYGDYFAAGPARAPSAQVLPDRSAAALLAGAAAVSAHLRFAAGDRMLCTPEITTADAFVATVFAAFSAGAGVVLSPAADPSRLARRREDEMVTVVVTD